jgi:transmembrane sensor
MTPALNAAHNDTEGEAREWFVLLMDTDTPQDVIVAWAQWIEVDPENRAAYDKVSELWDLSGTVVQDARRPSMSELAADRYDGVLPIGIWRRGRRSSLRIAWTAVGGGVIAAAAIAMAVIPFAPMSAPRNFETNRGQHLSAKLDDGSVIHLSAATALRVDFGRDERGIALRRGEALFEVAHDARRPFVVSTPLADVTAVGTAFDLDVEAAAVTLYVNEGVVSVEMDKAGPGAPPPVKVLQGQQLTLRRTDGRLVVVQDLSTSAPAWREGSLYYRDQPLSAVLADVNRYASRTIRLADPAVGDMRYTGAVRLDATDAWLDGLQAAFPITVGAGPDGPTLKKSVRPLPIR